MGRDVTVTATVTPGASSGDQWNVAGIGIIADNDNFWHLALVESPLSDGRKHAAELCEMHNDVWLGQNQKGATLTAVPGVGGFNWTAGVAYQFRLTVTPQEITGEIREGGLIRYSATYKFDAPAVTYGRPMIDCSGVAAQISQVSAEISSTVPDQKSTTTIPPFSWASDSLPGGRPTGYFHVQTIDGISWLVDPKGRLCFSAGTDHVVYQGNFSEKLGYSPYERIVAAKYPSEQAWALAQRKRLISWGFNTAGTGSSKSMFHAGLTHTQFLAFGSSFSTIANVVPKTTWTGFPDVFDARFAAFCNMRAMQICDPEKNDPWLLGYFCDNELEWYGKAPNYSVVGLAYGAWLHDGNAACKQALVAIARKTYAGNIADFNADFGTSYATFDDFLAGTTPGVAKTDKAKSVLEAFVSEVADRYFDVTTAAIRQHDPNHMVLGARFAGQAPNSAWIAAGRTCDIVSVNIYPRVDVETQSSPQLVKLLHDTHELCNKPMAVTEWSFPALDAVDSTGMKIPSVHGAGMRVDTQEQKALCYQVMQRILSSTPFMVGSEYFMYIDEPATGISATFPEDSNYGLVNEADTPYAVLTRAATRINATIVAVHAGRCARLSATAHDDSVVVRNDGRVGAKTPIAIWINGVRSDRTVYLAPGGSFTLSGAQVKRDGDEGAYVHVECDPDRTVAQTATQTQSADLVLRPTAHKLGQHAVVVWNPSPVSISGAVVHPDGGGESVRVDSLPSFGERTLWEPAKVAASKWPSTVSFTKTTQGGYVIDNGVLRLTKNQDTGTIFDTVELMGNGAPIDLGAYVPLVNMSTDSGPRWVRPDHVTDVKVVGQDADTLVVDVTAEHVAGDTAGFRCAYRIEVMAGEPCFESRILWIENTNRTPLGCLRYFHYTPSAFAAESVTSAHTNYYMSAGSWRSPSLGVEYGVAPLANDGRMDFGFYKDETGGEHPDCDREIDTVLKPEEKWQPSQPEPTVLIGGLKEQQAGTTEFPALARKMQVTLGVMAR
jgi:hypothetical protein